MTPFSDDPTDDSPCCLHCGAQVGLNEHAYVCLRGAWMWSHEHDVEVFVLDPDTQMAVIELSNGQLAVVTDRGNVTKHVDADCFEEVFDEDDENNEYHLHRLISGRID